MFEFKNHDSLLGVTLGAPGTWAMPFPSHSSYTSFPWSLASRCPSQQLRLFLGPSPLSRSWCLSASQVDSASKITSQIALLLSISGTPQPALEPLPSLPWTFPCSRCPASNMSLAFCTYNKKRAPHRGRISWLLSPSTPSLDTLLLLQLLFALTVACKHLLSSSKKLLELGAWQILPELNSIMISS